MMEPVARRVSSPVLVGRDEDVAAARAALARAAAGEPTVVLIGGDAGIGKSRLLQEVVTAAAGMGWTILSGSCVDLGEGSPPFAPVADALRRLRRTLGDERIHEALGLGADELTRLLPGWQAGQDSVGPVAPGRVFEAVLELLEALADLAPVLLTVEDAHWADPSTRDLLAFLTRTLAAVPVAIVTTFRTDELHRRHPLRGLVAELERQPQVVRLDLHPLDRDGVRAQLTAIQGVPPAPELVDDIWDRSEGNPFFAEELLLSDESCERLPASVREGMLARVAALPDSHQSVLRVAAAAGREVSDTLLLELTGLPRDEYDRIMRDLLGASLLVLDGDAFRFRHALLQEVVYDELLPGERVGLHVRVAEHLVSAPEGCCPTAELAHHWSQARRLPEALSASVAAAVEADAIGAPGDAVAHYQRALELWDSVPDAADRAALDRLEILDRAATSAASVGRFDLAVKLHQEALALAEAAGDVERVALFHTRVGKDLFVANRPGAAEEFEAGVRLVPDDPLSRVRAQVLAAHAQLLMLTGQLERARAVSQAALDAALAVGDRQVEGHARNTLGTVLANQRDERGFAELRQALQLAEEFGTAEDVGRAYVNLSHAYGEFGRWDDLLEVGERGLAATRRLGIDRTHGAYVETNVIEALVATGRWDDAAAAERSLATRVASPGWEYFAVSPLRADRGDLEGARAAIDAMGPLPVHDTAVLQGLTWAYEGQVALALWEGRTEAVSGLVEELLRRMPGAMRIWKLAPVLWRATWAEVDRGLLARARRDDGAVRAARGTAARWLGELRALADWTPEDGARPVVGSDAYTLLAAAEVDRLEDADTADAWIAAAARFDELGIVFPAAYARLRAAEAAVRAGDRTLAAELAEAAAGVARQLGARPLAALVEQLVTRGRLARGAEPVPEGQEVRGDGLGLSAREHEVLALLAEGRTNREIATLLYISPKTVSVHVSNILAKLGVSGRVEAAAVAHRLGLAV
jgi:DNA-binding NarL/FixJ family response regulator/tetratricopeptide (TPR) repeat protein